MKIFWKEEKFLTISLILRPIIVTLTLGAGLWVFLKTTEIPVAPLIWLIVSSFILSFLFFISSLMGRPLWLLQSIGDLSLTTGIVHFTGGIDSVFSLIYFFPIIVSSILLSLKTGFFLTTIAGIFYCSLLSLEFLKVLPSVLPLEQYSSIAVFFKGYIHFLSFYLVFFLSGYLAYRLRKEREKSKELKLTTQEILENLGEKVFVIAKGGKIIYSNAPSSPSFLTFILEENKREISVDGRIFKVSVNPLIIKGKEEIKIIVMKDITEEKKLNELIKLKEKSAFLGEISSGLAHEIRNPLSVLKGSLASLAKIKDPEKRKKLIALLNKETKRLEEVVETFIRYARMKEPLFEMINPIPLVESQINFFKKENIPISMSVQGSPYFLNLDPDLFILAIKNVIQNAVESLDSKQGNINIFLNFNEKELAFVCEDSGRGIKKELKEKIFYPFWTTKEKGIGMGLALVKRIVERHLGKIEVESPILNGQKGTRFTLFFPREEYAENKA